MPGSNPLVSVIIPAYNHELYVQETIRSIIAQTYQNLELLIIDDGSMDGTWQKIQEMEPECRRRFGRICFVEQEHSGACSAVNKIRSKAKGEYTYSIASDDVAHPTAIETLLKAIKSGNYILAVGNEIFIDGNGERIGVDEKFQAQPLFHAKYQTFCDFYVGETGIEYYRSEIFGSYSSFCVRNYIPNGYLILASARDQITLTKEAPLEDWFTHLQLSKMGRYKFVDEILFSYRLHQHNTIRDRKHLLEIANETIEYEARLCEKAPEAKRAFMQATIRKHYLNLGFLRIYKRKYGNYSFICLNLLGREFSWRHIPFHPFRKKS